VSDPEICPICNDEITNCDHIGFAAVVQVVGILTDVHEGYPVIDNTLITKYDSIIPEEDI